MKIKVVIIIVLVAVLSMGTYANAAVTEYEQDFQAYVHGEIPPEFVLFTGWDTYTRGVVNTYSPNMVYQYESIADAENDSGVYDSVFVVPSNPIVTVKMDALCDFDTRGEVTNCYIMFVTDDEHFCALEFYGASNVMLVYNGGMGGYAFGMFLDRNVWYEITIECNTETRTYSVMVDGVPLLPAQNLPMGYSNIMNPGLMFGSFANTGTNRALLAIDNISVVSEENIPDNPRTGETGSNNLVVVLIALLIFVSVGFIVRRKIAAKE